MFPLADSIPNRTFPYINWLLILANIVVFLYQNSLGAEQGILFLEYGMIPAKMMMPLSIVTLPEKIIPFFSSMFLHGGWFHLLGNVYFLYIFGDNVEDRLGHFRYLKMYLLFGVIAAVTQAVLFHQSQIPTIGASGAVAGVMGAYFIFYPYAKVKTLIFVFVLITVVELPAVLFLGLWFLMQFLSGAADASINAGGVAWWSHIGGFIAGVLYAMMLVLRKRRELYRF